MEIGIKEATKSVIRDMRQTNRTERARFGELRAAYQVEWCGFSLAVARWQSLQNGAQLTESKRAEAESAARLAEERYRRARNALADHILSHSLEKDMPALESRAGYLLSLRTGVEPAAPV